MIFTAVFELLWEAAAVIAGCGDSSASLQNFTVVGNVFKCVWNVIVKQENEVQESI